MLPRTKTLWALAAGLALPCLLLAQKEILLNNPSFEDTPAAGKTPQGWYNCGAPEETPPDIQPGAFGVTKAPNHGKTYVGLVVRDNETNEAVGQRLARPLEADECYEFSVDLCRSETYISLSRTTAEMVNYATPVVLRVWGGNAYCEKGEMLYETNVITTTRWLTYTFRLHPKRGNYTYLTIEAYYKTPTLFPYNGNVLLDNATPIRQIDCNMPAMVETPLTPPLPNETPADKTKKNPEPLVQPERTSTRTPPPTVAVAATPPSSSSMVLETISRSSLRKGSTFQLRNLYFDADKYTIKEECVPSLEAVYRFLVENPDVVIEVGGHTNNWPSDDFAQTLSTNRAKAVADWLVGKGIPRERVHHKGYGKTQPIDTNLTPEGRKRNQRVEFKIISMREN
ncbi:MAG: OmpA family protein [Saprospiraceae bacterium]|nr:OmpA family protein [Saprospiraceae bacterium]MDW8229341.1 OmpA family protein [Saprospiraceae bacterium]